MIERLLSEALTTRFKEDDLSDCFLIDVQKGKGDRVEVFIDSDSRLTLDRCRIVSRYLEKQIEEKGWLGEKYTLEVSSPGIDRPLKLKRQYVKNIGRKISVLTEDEQKLEGTLEDVDENGIGISNEKGKTQIGFDNIKKAKILISFK